MPKIAYTYIATALNLILLIVSEIRQNTSTDYMCVDYFFLSCPIGVIHSNGTCSNSIVRNSDKSHLNTFIHLENKWEHVIKVAPHQIIDGTRAIKAWFSLIWLRLTEWIRLNWPQTLRPKSFFLKNYTNKYKNKFKADISDRTE